jgi:hypothetical protein
MTEKKINSDLEKLPACAAGFIKLVIKKMGYRKKVRADVMAELITHFEDELKGIATAEQKAQQLIEQFGDVKLLAKLIRRGKKRCRPIWQKVLIRSFVTVSVFILYVLVRVAFLKIGTATISVDYAQWLTERSRADRPEQGNAYPHYKKAVGMYVTSPKSIRGKLRRMTLVCPMPSGYNLKDFNDMDVDQLAKWLAENEPAFEILRAGSVKPYYWAPYSGGDKSLMEGPLIIGANEQLGPYRKLAQAMLTNIYLQVSMDNTPQALNDSLVLNSFGMHLQGRGLLIEQMVGIAIEGVGHRAILQMLSVRQHFGTTLFSVDLPMTVWGRVVYWTWEPHLWQKMSQAPC